MTDYKNLLIKNKWINKTLFILLPYISAVIFLIIVFLLPDNNYYENNIIITYILLGGFVTIKYYQFENNPNILKSIVFTLIYFYVSSEYDHLLYPKSELPLTLGNIIQPRIIYSVNFFTLASAIVFLTSLVFWKKFKKN